MLEWPLDQPLFVAGPRGSGKTSLAIWRANALTKLHEEVPIVTFNRMLRRKLTLTSHEHSIKTSAATMQRFVWHDYSSRTNNEEPPRKSHDPYEYVWDLMIERLAADGPVRQALVVDEGQDLPQGFFACASQCVARTLSVFADDDQAIGSHRSTLEQIKSAATVMRPASGDVPQLVQSDNLQSTIDRIANELTNRANSSIVVIVARNETGAHVHKLLRQRMPKARIKVYSSDRTNEDSINVRQPGVTVLNKESVKGQEFDTVFLLELEHFIPCRDDSTYRAMYMMCTRARDRLFLVYGPGPLSKQVRDALPSDATILEQ
ncbi:MAG: AAA family ATPase [Gammaproteobacteria bacterium]|nr:AAA family ATPase [Gammaproteobacteria bacterium]